MMCVCQCIPTTYTHILKATDITIFTCCFKSKPTLDDTKDTYLNLVVASVRSYSLQNCRVHQSLHPCRVRRSEKIVFFSGQAVRHQTGCPRVYRVCITSAEEETRRSRSVKSRTVRYDRVVLYRNCAGRLRCLEKQIRVISSVLGLD